jgi:hypothetical protein
VNAAAIDRLFRGWSGPGAQGLQDGVNAVRGAIEKAPVVAALKAILADHRRDPGWEVLRPPLVPLAPARREALLAELAGLGFRLGG